MVPCFEMNFTSGLVRSPELTQKLTKIRKILHRFQFGNPDLDDLSHRKEETSNVAKS